MKYFKPLIMGIIISFIASKPTLSRDSDYDGITDALDRCPNTAQLSKLPIDFKYKAAVNPDRLQPGPRAYPVDKHGCEPDTDGDGIVNSKDYCPDDSRIALSHGVAPNGCPKQSDADGTPDYRDKCPNTTRGVRTNRYGCEIKA